MRLWRRGIKNCMCCVATRGLGRMIPTKFCCEPGDGLAPMWGEHRVPLDTGGPASATE